MSTGTLTLSDHMVARVLEINGECVPHHQSPSTAWVVARLAEEVQARRAAGRESERTG